MGYGGEREKKREEERGWYLIYNNKGRRQEVSDKESFCIELCKIIIVKFILASDT